MRKTTHDIANATCQNQYKYIDDINQLTSDSRPLVLPASCQLTLSKCSLDEKHAKQIKSMLHKYGIVVITLSYTDNQGKMMQTIVDRIGKPHVHNSDETVMWDIKSGGTTGKESLARSHKLNEFVLHTDCSYEKKVPTFFGLQVIEHDRYGGGQNLLLDATTLVQHLTPKTRRVLQNDPVKINVPEEFRKNDGLDYIIEPILDKDFKLRFRKEIFDQSSLSGDQKKAIQDFEHHAYNTMVTRSVSLKKNQIFLLDNQRYLHARTNVLDPERHLKRIRFFMEGY
jgi:alpha-ketoglutarate-dependent taurine dioxygenase